MGVLLFIILVVGCIVFLYKFNKKENEKADYYRELARPYEWSNDKIGSIKKRFENNPELLKEAEAIYADRRKMEHFGRESRKKESIQRRVLAYDYEVMLYQIFAPTAKEHYGVWYSVSVHEFEMIKRISEINNISKEEAKKLLEFLKRNYLLLEIQGDTGKEYTLSTMLEDYPGDNNEWNVVSDIDMNLDKWMISHGYEHKKN